MKQTLQQFLAEQCTLADKSSKEWEAAGDPVNAAYRNGMWYAYRDVERFIGPDVHRVRHVNSKQTPWSNPKQPAGSNDAPEWTNPELK